MKICSKSQQKSKFRKILENLNKNQNLEKFLKISKFYFIFVENIKKIGKSQHGNFKIVVTSKFGIILLKIFVYVNNLPYPGYAIFTTLPFSRELNDLLENRVFVFFRRMARNVQIYEDNPVSLYILLDQTNQVRSEVHFLHKFGKDILAPIQIVQSEVDVAGHVLEKLVGWVEHVELACPLILPEFYHMLCQTFKPEFEKLSEFWKKNRNFLKSPI